MGKSRETGNLVSINNISADIVNDRVGIGIPIPTSKLDVNGNITTNSQLISTVSTGTSPLSVSSTTLVTNLNADLLDGINSGSFFRSDADDTATGNYLFNKNNPAISNTSYGTGNNHIEFRTTDGSNPILGFHRSGFTAVALYHSGYGANALRIRGADGLDGQVWWAGNDGAGSGLDADLLDGINSGSFLRSDVNVWNTSTDGQARFFFSTNDRSYYRSANGHEWRNSADSNIGLLDNSGSMNIAQFYSGRGFKCRTGINGTSGNTFNINWTGSAAQLWIDSTNIGTFISDYRVKKNIEPIEENALERIKQLRPVKYERRDYKIFKEDGLVREGFIAHEVGEVIPSGVQGEKDDQKEIQSLNLDAIVAVLTKAVQEQQKIIENQQKQIDELKTQIELLK
jgi:hypothetical protein